MSIRKQFLTLFLAFALLLCAVNLSATDTSFRYVSGALSFNGKSCDRGFSSITNTAPVEPGIIESINRLNNVLLYGTRPQTKGATFHRSGTGILSVFAALLCSVNTAVWPFRSGSFLPEDATASFTTLLYIHSKDGKK